MALFAHPEPATGGTAVEVLDLRHFSAAELGPLLRDEARRWNARHRWDYSRAIELLLEYLDGRVLPGFVALDRNRRLLGYTFCVYEADKAVIGDLYAFNESEDLPSPVCATLLTHLIEMLQASPGLRRIESQLLMFPAGALGAVFSTHGFRSFPRLFLLAELHAASPLLRAPNTPDSPIAIEHWRPERHHEAAELIHRCYRGHGDALINDQYQTVPGAERFLHNIIRFPGCGLFDPEGSLLARDRRTGALAGLLLSSRVRNDAAHITQLCVAPAHRGHGLGRRLLTHSASELHRRGAAAVSLTVTEANAPARALYGSLAFRTLHRFEAATWDQPHR